uniref:Uncharacterized protein n=1 Tax=Arundo donax TaxID=35708 RepID=A0A0A9FAT4_ARUDO
MTNFPRESIILYCKHEHVKLQFPKRKLYSTSKEFRAKISLINRPRVLIVCGTWACANKSQQKHFIPVEIRERGKDFLPEKLAHSVLQPVLSCIWTNAGICEEVNTNYL